MPLVLGATCFGCYLISGERVFGAQDGIGNGLSKIGCYLISRLRFAYSSDSGKKKLHTYIRTAFFGDDGWYLIGD